MMIFIISKHSLLSSPHFILLFVFECAVYFSTRGLPFLLLFNTSSLKYPVLHLVYRQKHTQHNHIAILKLENVESRQEANWYVGKKVAYVTAGLAKGKGVRKFQRKATKAIHVTWGKIRKVFTLPLSLFSP